MQIVSKVLSVIFHPMLIPTLGLFIIFNVGGHLTYLPIDHQRVVYLIVFLSTCVLPLTLVPLFMLLGVIKSVHMRERRERIIPTVFTGFFYLLGYFLLNRIPIVPSVVKGFMLATILVIAIALAITFFWKISMHMIGIGGLTGAVLALSVRFGIDTWLIFSSVLLISGLLGSSRLYLNAHTPYQVHVGYLLGGLVVFWGVLL